MTGLLHSIQTLGAVDGPGLRTVVILQGCPLQCIFCHSIDTTMMDRGRKVSVEELYDEVAKNRPYWKRYVRRGEVHDPMDPSIVGGVTITGGDPLSQPAFLSEFLKKLKSEGIHTVVETSLYTSQHVVDMLIDHVDLWMVSIKHMNDDKHLELTGKSNKSVLENLIYLDKRLQEMGRKESLRIRFVVIPGYTDQSEHTKELGRYLQQLKSIESIELLPYVTMGRYKWIELFGEYQLEDVMPAEKEDVENVSSVLVEMDLPLFEVN